MGAAACTSSRNLPKDDADDISEEKEQMTATTPNSQQQNDSPIDLKLPEEMEVLIPVDNRLRDFTTLFSQVRALGEGSTCAVLEMKEESSGMGFAVKRMDRAAKSSHRGFKREAEILLKVHHNHVVALHGLYADEQNYWIAQELCTGGMVLEHVRTRQNFTERDAIEIVNQIVQGLSFLHSHNIVHRDIKPDNIVYQSKRRNRIVLIDFGQAREVQAEQVFTDWVGTPAYMAPEVTHERTGAVLKKVDMWAVGVTTFVILTGFLPFFGRNVKELMREICQKKLSFPKSVPLTTQARRFVSSLLRRNVERRLTADEALSNEWVTMPEEMQTLHFNLKRYTDNISSYSQSTGLKRMVVDMVRTELTEQDQKDIQDAFDLIDINQDGSIEQQELAEFLKNRKLTTQRAEVRAGIQFQVMGDGSEQVDLPTFTNLTLAEKLATDEGLIKEMFSKIDKDGDGKITPDEIQEAKSDFFGEELTLEECKEMLKEIGRDKEGYVTFHSFADAMVHLTQRSNKASTMADELGIVNEDEEVSG